ncbi:MAG: flagellar protein [Anaerolineae bacterium]|nr:flagellar protein [Anaerolineae bacterium]
MVEKVTLPLTPEPIRSDLHARRSAPTQPPAPGQPDFATVLRREAGASRLRFSNHAEARLRSRAIELSAAQRERIERAVEAADRKGAQSSLILLDDLALVVSIRDRTVITAIDAKHRKSNVFTHIDSAVLA